MNKELKVNLYWMKNLSKNKPVLKRWILINIIPYFLLLIVSIIIGLSVEDSSKSVNVMISFFMLSPVAFCLPIIKKIKNEIANKELSLKISYGMKYSEYFAAKNVSYILKSLSITTSTLIVLLCWNKIDLDLILITYLFTNCLNVFMLNSVIYFSAKLKNSNAAIIPILILVGLASATAGFSSEYVIGFIPMNLPKNDLYLIFLPLSFLTISFSFLFTYLINPRLTFVRWDNDKSQ